MRSFEKHSEDNPTVRKISTEHDKSVLADTCTALWRLVGGERTLALYAIKRPHSVASLYSDGHADRSVVSIFAVRIRNAETCLVRRIAHNCRRGVKEKIEASLTFNPLDDNQRTNRQSLPSSLERHCDEILVPIDSEAWIADVVVKGGRDRRWRQRAPVAFTILFPPQYAAYERIEVFVADTVIGIVEAN